MGLIIDQDHNCGGSVEFTHKMLSLFVEENVPPLQFQLRANKQEYVDYLSWVKQLDPHTVDYENNKKVLDSIRTSWEAGNFLTPKTPIYGDREVHPHTIRYTKPIVMLIDELAGSGGDAFPALMQGYGRAKLLGTRTMGAGGHVTDEEPLYNSQLNLRLTKSLFFRPDGIPVENNGAKPDVPYAITRDDFTNGYRGYQAFYIKKLLEQIQRSQTGLW
jgi:C-terminal processing protease CtpA/Prc